MVKLITPKVEFSIYDSENELGVTEKNLVEEAKNSCSLAHAPYSNFTVGASLLLENGAIIKGSNQENAAYPSGLCAERVAFYSSSVTYPSIKILKMAIVAKKMEEEVFLPAPPCGSCRQSMLEFETKQGQLIEIIFMASNGNWVKTPSVKALLPFCFEAKNLN